MRAPFGTTPLHGVNEMIASLHPGGRHAARERALATVDPSVGDCSHVGNRTGMASLSARKPERRAGVRPRSLRGTKAGLPVLLQLPVRFADRRANCLWGCRSVPRRKRIKDGLLCRHAASTAPKSVSAEITIRSSICARSKMSESSAVCKP